MPFAQGLPFARGSHTSRQAALRQARNSKRGEKVMRVLMAYQAAGERGLTGAELEDKTGLPIQSICSIRKALEEDGLIAKGGQRTGRYGDRVGVWFYIGPKSAA